MDSRYVKEFQERLVLHKLLKEVTKKIKQEKA
ncbi:hypothetical protein SAMN00017405_1665 [Desulfonispora thiosulfatigenes DSM 11270]|uniref:Uncharacterized protein n=1 Tax=Desulfonispora thiosulfatigenes DSM 11270 TaxID=656914 RepID=A0A1W1UYC2_DESTI|nr:hypothetical protein SAMN00017405_1665 [Desulfonispora thiosulfatigenes DSM 11270]